MTYKEWEKEVYKKQKKVEDTLYLTCFSEVMLDLIDIEYKHVSACGNDIAEVSTICLNYANSMKISNRISDEGFDAVCNLVNTIGWGYEE